MASGIWFSINFLAIAIQDPTLDGTLARKVGHQAHLTLPASRKFNRIIYVGGGLEVCDGNDQRKALFVPLDQKHPLGNPSLLQIRFQIPKVLLPGLNAKSKITILCGLQDDHGGLDLAILERFCPKLITGMAAGRLAITDRRFTMCWRLIEIRVLPSKDQVLYLVN